MFQQPTRLGASGRNQNASIRNFYLLSPENKNTYNMLFFISAFDLDPLNFLLTGCDINDCCFIGVWNENIEHFLCASQ